MQWRVSVRQYWVEFLEISIGLAGKHQDFMDWNEERSVRTAIISTATAAFIRLLYPEVGTLRTNFIRQKLGGKA